MTTIWVPGKAMVIGEYAVLDGAPAVVAAVSAFATATVQPTSDGTAPSPFVVAALAEARRVLQDAGVVAPTLLPHIDTSAFARNGKKLGIGSSAAATVAAVAVILAAAGVDVSGPDGRALVFQAARAAHNHAQGQIGSGADILAATYGGLLALNQGASATGQSPVVALTLPASVSMYFVATAQSASTPDLVARYRAAGGRTEAAKQTMAQAAAGFIQACQSGSAQPLFAAVAEAARAYDALGMVIDAPLLTESHRQIGELAHALGGSAKPSGAGGGDLAVVLLPATVDPAQFAARLPPSTDLLELQTTPLGVHLAADEVIKQP